MFASLPFYTNSWHWTSTSLLLNFGCPINQTNGVRSSILDMSPTRSEDKGTQIVPEFGLIYQDFSNVSQDILSGLIKNQSLLKLRKERANRCPILVTHIGRRLYFVYFNMWGQFHTNFYVNRYSKQMFI